MGSKSSPKEPAFTIRCLGDELLLLDLRCADESKILYYRLEEVDEIRELSDAESLYCVDERDMGEPRYIRSPKHIVSMVNDYCVGRVEIVETHNKHYPHHHTHRLCRLSRKLRKFNYEFLRGKPLSICAILLIKQSWFVVVGGGGWLGILRPQFNDGGSLVVDSTQRIPCILKLKNHQERVVLWLHGGHLPTAMLDMVVAAEAAIQLRIISLLDLLRDTIIYCHDGNIKSLMYAVGNANDAKKAKVPLYIQNTWAFHGITFPQSP